MAGMKGEWETKIKIQEGNNAMGQLRWKICATAAGKKDIRLQAEHSTAGYYSQLIAETNC